MKMINREQVFEAHAKQIMVSFGMVGFKKNFRRLSITIYKSMGFWALLQTEKLKEKHEAQIAHLNEKCDKFYLDVVGKSLEAYTKKDLEIEDLKKKLEVATHALSSISGKFTFKKDASTIECEVKEICNNTLAVIK